MLSIGKVLAKILKYIDALASTTEIFTTTEHTCDSQTQAKATQTSYRQSFTKAGYYPLGIVGWYMEGTGVGQLVPYMMRVETAANGSARVNYGIRNNNSNTDITVKLHIMILWKKVGGVLLSSIFKAFSHLQEIGGGINAGHQEINRKDIKEHKNAFNCAFCYGICGSKERKRLYNRTDSKWLHVFAVVCDKDRRLGWRGLQFTSQCSNGKGLDSAKQHRNRKWKCDLLRLIHKERLGVIASERRCYYA